MRLLLAALALLASSSAFAGAAPTSQTYAAQHVDQFRNGTPGMMIFKGAENNNAYMLQGNPATGALLVEGDFAVDILAQGLNGDPIPDYSLQVGGNFSGDLIPIKVGADGTVATSGTSTVTGTVTVSNLPTTADTNFGTPGASTLRSASMLGVGSTAVSNSNPVPISDAGSSITVDGTVAATQSGTWTVQPGNTANTTPWLSTIAQGGNSATVSAGGALKVDASGSTQPVSGTVAVTQSTSPWIVAGGGTAGTAASGVVTVQGIASMTAVKVDGSAVTQPVSGTVATSNFPSTVDTNAGANSASTLRVTQGSRVYADSANNDYSSVNVTTAAWVQLIASTAAAINLLCITDTGGQVMEIGTGAALSETRVFLVAQGWSGCIPLRIAASTRVSVKAVTATANSGYLTISGMN